MSQAGHLTEEADIGSGERKNSGQELVDEEIRKINPDEAPLDKAPERQTPDAEQPPASSDRGKPTRQ